MLTQDKVRIHLHLTIQVAEENVHKIHKLYLLDNTKNAAENIYRIHLPQSKVSKPFQCKLLVH